jgi:hypothetical protein
MAPVVLTWATVHLCIGGAGVRGISWPALEGLVNIMPEGCLTPGRIFFMFTSLVLYLRACQRLLTLQPQLHIFSIYLLFYCLLKCLLGWFFIIYDCSCQLALGDLEDALRSYMTCLNSNTGTSSDPKILAEASDGLERVKVSCFFC